MQLPTILFIAGWGRSGTTLLDRLLGSCSGAFSAGEVRYLWDRGLLEGRVCSCGEPIAGCPLWSLVARRFLGLPAASIEALVGARDRFRTRKLWRRRFRELDGDGQAGLQAYLDSLGEVFRRLHLETGSPVIVDSSKFPSHGALLRRLSGARVFVVHLVRDPRGVAFSWRKRKVYDGTAEAPRLIDRHGPAKSALYWSVWNLTIERFLASSAQSDGGSLYMRVAYEDLASRPRETVERILGRVGAEGGASCFVSPNEASLVPGHLVAGNPMRFRSGRIVIEPDDLWKREMPSASRLTVTLLTAPLLRRYGYSWSPRS